MIFTAARGGKYELREPLLALRKAVCEALQHPQEAQQALLELAVAARQTGHLTHAMAAAHELSTLQAGSAAAGENRNHEPLAKCFSAASDMLLHYCS